MSNNRAFFVVAQGISEWIIEVHITMVRFRPLNGVVGPLPNGHKWLINGTDNHLLTGMILQVGFLHYLIGYPPINPSFATIASLGKLPHPRYVACT